MKKLSLSLCVVILLSVLLTSFGATAVGEPNFYVENATVTPGENLTVKVGVNGLTAEKAMDTFGVTLTYPEGFTYVSSEATAKVTDVCKLSMDGVEEPTYWIEHDAAAKTVTLVAVVNTVLAPAGIATDGILMNVTFTSPAEASFASTGYTFQATAMEGGFVDLTGQTVEVTVTEGNVTKTITVLKGDVNGDGAVNIKDRIAVLRYFGGWPDYATIDTVAGDVNNDGVFNVKDRVQIIRYFAGWTGITLGE